MRKGLDYTQTKAVFKQARAKAGLHAPKEHRGSPARLTLEEELRFIDQAYAQSGQGHCQINEAILPICEVLVRNVSGAAALPIADNATFQ